MNPAQHKTVNNKLVRESVFTMSADKTVPCGQFIRVLSVFIFPGVPPEENLLSPFFMVKCQFLTVMQLN